MTDPEIVERFNSPSTTAIYGRMYGQEYITEIKIGGKKYRNKDKIIKISKGEVTFNIDGRVILFVWGFPGPDYNIYKFDDYGKTWAFDRNELDGEDA